MKTAVLVKVVDGEINPFDASAVEWALSLGGEVTVISMGPRTWEGVLLPLTRLGVGRVILLSDPVFAGSDTLATAYVLSRALARLDYGLLLAGRKTLDGETGQVAPCLAETLGIPVLTNVFSFAVGDGAIVAETALGTERVGLPACLSLERTKQLRFPSLFSQTGEVEIWDSQTVGTDPARCGLAGSPTRVIETFENRKGERACKMIAPTDLPDLFRDLRKKQKRKAAAAESETKLPSVWAVGEEVLGEARAIAKEVVLIGKDSPEAIAGRAKTERPDVILWNADVWGRRNAPIVQAMLETGLCADCTELETDGKRLVMIRPAKGGSVTAKILCRTRPQMATVRTVDEKAGDLIVSAGRGVADEVGAVRAFAGRLGAEFCASRALVDLGLADYPEQVGLTGRVVSPKIYLAIGISGAVQHLVGMRDADAVIAVNPDPDAPIFGFADYGIVGTFASLMRETDGRFPEGDKRNVGL